MVAVPPVPVYDTQHRTFLSVRGVERLYKRALSKQRREFRDIFVKHLKSTGNTQVLEILQTLRRSGRCWYTWCGPSKCEQLCRLINDAELLMLPPARAKLQLGQSAFDAAMLHVDLSCHKSYAASLRRLYAQKEYHLPYAVARSYISTYHEARHVRDMATYQEHRRKSPWHTKALPERPHKYYACDGYQSFAAFCGRSPFASYERARALVKELGFKSSCEYRKGFHAQPQLPADPPRVYLGKGWQSWDEFLA